MSSPTTNISLRTSLILSVTVSMIFAVSDMFANGTVHLLLFFLILIFLFLFSFFLFRYTIETFIYQKIRLIYKTIHSFKVNKDQKEMLQKQLEHKEDLFEDVNAEVVLWMQSRIEEIEAQKNLEQYRKDFFGNVLHELKTPVFSIQGYVHTLLDGGLEDQQINRKYLLRADNNLDRLKNIILDMESISQLESGELNIDVQRFNIITLCKEIIDSHDIRTQKKNITVSVIEPGQRPLNVMGDKEKIRQVITNLIVNSINYGIENGKTKINFFDMDENILVEVTDNGIGISQEHLPRIFERFYRVDKSRSRDQGGTGLGLAIVKHFVEAHQQTINVRSTVGMGTTFGFTLQKG
ncbi:MAG: ATP-binding protein [Bacteroidota bacterium]